VTERRALEEQFRQSQRMEAVGQLAGGVAHDFNNLLTVINGSCAMLAESLPANSSLHEELTEISRATDRAVSLTRQLLAFSRRQLLAPRVLDLSDSLRAMEPMLRRLLGEHIEIVARSAPDVAPIKADPGQIEQVILNLAINARDAMPEGGTLTFDLANAPNAPRPAGSDAAEGPHVLLSVTDTGTGMDAATAARIFEPFFTTKPMGKGTGLGLATVHGIVRQSGGTISVYTELGRGTTFKVSLPQANGAVESAPPKIITAARSSTETILVVEDDDGLRRQVVRMLEREGFHVLSAGTPNDAMHLARAHPDGIDLLLTDVVLPEMNGRALAEQLVARFPRMKVLYMSGYTDDAVVERGVREHEVHFVQKPFDPASLARKVAEVLGQRPATTVV
jgi:two-component system, cell cycle sensor histidine kinase and response regulator CckA